MHQFFQATVFLMSTDGEEKKKNPDLVSASLCYLFKSMIAIRNILNLINLCFFPLFFSVLPGKDI